MKKNIDEEFHFVPKIISTAVKATKPFRIEKMNISYAQWSFQTNDPANAVEVFMTCYQKNLADHYNPGAPAL